MPPSTLMAAVSDGSRAHPRLGHLDFANFHLRDASAERDPRGLDRLPEGLRLRFQVCSILVGPDPDEFVLRPIDPGRHDRPADLVMNRLGLLFEVLDEVIQLALVDGVNADLCLHLLCLHSRRGVFSLSILSGKKSQTCLVTALDLPPPLYPCAAYRSLVHDRESRAKKMGRAGHMDWTTLLAYLSDATGCQLCSASSRLARSCLTSTLGKVGSVATPANAIPVRADLE